MDSGLDKRVKMPMLRLEQGAELECYNRFIKRFEIAVIGAGLNEVRLDSKGKPTASSTDRELDRRKAVLLLDSMGEIGMDIFDSWNIEVSDMEYSEIKHHLMTIFHEKKTS